MAKKVADQLVDTLEKAGVRRIYAVTGDSLNEVNEAVRKNGRLRWIHVRHEETGAYAAAAEAQLTGARHSAGQVGGAQEPRGLIQHTADLHFAEGVVAKGHGVGSGVVDPPRLLAGQTHAGDVFPVDHGERNVFQLLQGPQMAFQMGETCLAYHIAHSQNGIEHGVPPNI